MWSSLSVTPFSFFSLLFCAKFPSTASTAPQPPRSDLYFPDLNLRLPIRSGRPCEQFESAYSVV
ncbi:unnamed protein product [Rhodiola kirilowii]